MLLPCRAACYSRDGPWRDAILLPAWPDLPAISKSADPTAKQSATDAGNSHMAGAWPAPLDLANMKDPLPEPTVIDKTAASEYVSELAKGVEFEQSQKYDEAREHFKTLIVKWPAEYQAYHLLGQLCDSAKTLCRGPGLLSTRHPLGAEAQPCHLQRSRLQLFPPRQFEQG